MAGRMARPVPSAVGGGRQPGAAVLREQGPAGSGGMESCFPGGNATLLLEAVVAVCWQALRCGHGHGFIPAV